MKVKDMILFLEKIDGDLDLHFQIYKYFDLDDSYDYEALEVINISSAFFHSKPHVIITFEDSCNG